MAPQAPFVGDIEKRFDGRYTQSLAGGRVSQVRQALEIQTLSCEELLFGAPQENSPPV